MQPKQCDCCAKLRYTVERTWAYGLETFACAICRTDPRDEEARNEAWEEEAEAKTWAVGF